MKPIVLEFEGGYWDGRSLSTGSSDQEEALLATACYEISHHGAVGAECAALSGDAVTFARIHGWPNSREGTFCGDHRYRVTEHKETEDEIIVRLRQVPAEDPSTASTA
jgi:hypothetical protein